jgi:5'-phosphate synthase pdxT subunit
MMKIAVLALQGAFIEHEKMLAKLGAESFEIRQKADLQQDFDGLIIPGGESTVIGKLLHDLDLYDEIKKRISSGLPVFGTCAGLILLAKDVDGGETCFGTMDIKACRNAYGRQLGSFFAEENFGEIGKVPMTFIRAPYIAEFGENVQPLATVGGKIVAAKQNNMLVTAFHPELNDDTRIHEYFLTMCK